MDTGILDTDARESDNSSRDISEILTTRFSNLNPTRRRIIVELFDRGDLIGEWDITAHDFGLAWDPEGLLQAKEGFSRARSVFGALAAWGALTVNSKLPRLLGQIRADNLRRDYTPEMSLPLHVSEGLKSVLLTRVPNRELLWLTIDEPAGYIPYVNWERLLRPHVGVPIVRLAGCPVNPVSPHNSLDVLMTCSTATIAITTAPRRIARLIKGILSTLPAPHRCIVHLFADENYRPGVLAALTKAKVPLVETGEPIGHRGVIAYPAPDLGISENDFAGDLGAADHPWAAWIGESLGAKAVDVVHVIADGHLSAAIAALKVSAVPWADRQQPLPSEPPQDGKRHALNLPLLRKAHTEQWVRVGYVDALQMRDFVRRLGAWATILSSAQESARGAHRVLAHRLSQTVTGVFAVHEFDGDATGKSATALYRMLLADKVVATKDASQGVPVPDTSHLSFYCPPERILGTARQQAMTAAFPDIAEAVEKIRAAMEVPLATPAWLAVSQRYFEDAASTYLGSQPSSERASAAREGVGDALEFALRAIAESSGSAPEHPAVDAGREVDQ
jgi:hypothetical protein